MKKLTLFALFVGTVYAANWALGRWGIITLPVVGLAAPAGVYFAGLSFGLRDALHETAGPNWRQWVLAAIATGALLSYLVEDAVTIPGGHAPIAVASGVAFGLSELADVTVYTPLRNRNWIGAVVASNVVGAVVDSALFLWLAFGALDTMPGQIVGKVAMTALAVPVVWAARNR